MKILIACGGSAGHLFPGLALAEEIKKEDESEQITIVASGRPRDKEYLNSAVISQRLNYETISTTSLPYGFSFRYIPFALKLLLAVLKSFYIILKQRPRVVVGFGGYTSFAPLIVAHALGIPTLIHEQNLVPGRANRLLAPFVDKIAVSFDQTINFFSELKVGDKVVRTGLPLRRSILESESPGEDTIFTGSEDKFTILVVGGSQGAHNINRLILDCLNQMSEQERLQIRLIHLSGMKDLGSLQARYRAWGDDFRVFDFRKDMAGLYRIADLLIGRSGAGTIFEAALFGLACILIPHAYGTHHQQQNASFLKRQGAALVLEEARASVAELKGLLHQLIVDQDMRRKLADKIKGLANVEAAKRLKEEIQSL
jgi:UDP-N-acetylglucosamine--N-acetylmuramyl-(pentapeptide) pyrophosphoryl-undecaprenol N-acetylglucosamine transferase